MQLGWWSNHVHRRAYFSIPGISGKVWQPAANYLCGLLFVLNLYSCIIIDKEEKAIHTASSFTFSELTMSSLLMRVNIERCHSHDLSSGENCARSGILIPLIIIDIDV